MPHDLTLEHSQEIQAAASSSSSELEKEFAAAILFVTKAVPTKGEVSTEDKLTLYGYFKQSHEGDVKGAQPWAVQFELRLKWDAWNGDKGMSHDDAAKAYIAELETQKVKYGLVLRE